MPYIASIIIATYNRAHCITNAIDSALLTIKDSGTSMEIIIVDDCSNDDTEKLLNKKYKEKISSGDIIYFKLTANKGVSGARNAGVVRAKGDWVIFFDSDDTLIEDSACNIFNEIKNNSDASVIFFRCIDQDGHRVGSNFKQTSQPINLKNFLLFGSFGECLVAIKRDFATNFPFDEALRGYEGLTIARIIKHSGKPGVLSSSFARKYIQSGGDRLSSKLGFAPRMLLIGKGHWLMAKEFYKDMPISATISYALKSLAYKILYYKFKLFN